jgi:hypothetical protein
VLLDDEGARRTGRERPLSFGGVLADGFGGRLQVSLLTVLSKIWHDDPIR